MDTGRILGVFIAWPLLAIVPGALFLLAFARCRRPVILLAALAWFAYTPYELAMKFRILCSGECNIRVDLLLLYPLLAAVSVAGVIALVATSSSRDRT